MIATPGQLKKRADEIRAQGGSIGSIVSRLRAEFPELTLLKAHRLAHGWTRLEVLRMLDKLYEQDGLMVLPQLASVLSRWEAGGVFPSHERLDYLCRLYQTRPDRLGFGRDYTPPPVPQVRTTCYEVATIRQATLNSDRVDLVAFVCCELDGHQPPCVAEGVEDGEDGTQLHWRMTWTTRGVREGSVPDRSPSDGT